VVARLEPLATSHLVIDNEFRRDLEPELWQGDGADSRDRGGGVVAVAVEATVERAPAEAFAIAAPPPTITPETASVSDAIRNRFIAQFISSRLSLMS